MPRQTLTRNVNRPRPATPQAPRALGPDARLLVPPANAEAAGTRQSLGRPPREVGASCQRAGKPLGRAKWSRSIAQPAFRPAQWGPGARAALRCGFSGQPTNGTEAESSSRSGLGVGSERGTSPTGASSGKKQPEAAGQEGVLGRRPPPPGWASVSIPAPPAT